MEFVYQSLAQALDVLFGGDGRLWAVVGRTLLLAVESTAIALVLGLPLGAWLGERRTRARRTGVALANAGLGLPPVVLGVMLALAYLPLSRYLSLSLTNTLAGIVVAQALLALPIVIALTATAVDGLPRGLLEQARAFGARTPERLLLALREARVGVMAAVIAAVLSALAEVGAVVIVGGNIDGSTNTLASTILLDLSQADFGRATADSLVLLTLVVIVAATLTRVQQRAAR